MDDAPLIGKLVLITGAARRVGRALALASAGAGADVIIHYHTASREAESARLEIQGLGRQAWCLQADLAEPHDVESLAEKAFQIGYVYGLVNNAAVFFGGSFDNTTLDEWNTHQAVNVRAPFLLAQAYGKRLPTGNEGRVVNLLDWRATRPGADHFAYTVSKAALAAMTSSLAQSMAPRVSVNGLALGAFLPPEGNTRDPDIVRHIPAGRWGALDEAGRALVFLLAGPAYITGQIIHVDGGRHLL